MGLQSLQCRHKQLMMAKDIVRRNIAFAQRIAHYLDTSPDYELINRSPRVSTDSKGTEAKYIIPLNIVLFCGSSKSPFPPDEANSAANLTKTINDTRRMYVTGTKWRGRGAIRLAVSNWRTGDGGDEEWDVVQVVFEEVMKR